MSAIFVAIKVIAINQDIGPLSLFSHLGNSRGFCLELKSVLRILAEVVRVMECPVWVF